ncbi:S-layer protein [Planoprotostelium fungivorum]|uniref:S-layer protein n=1 Tax=Planoprotostelium fungivorum TaxID=1890364 RepID=A0A2P6NTV0_9EUKA|nr:S-layer protein [Planoprotostelium fungivorum]
MEEEDYSPLNQYVWIFGYNGQNQLDLGGTPTDIRVVSPPKAIDLPKRARNIAMACSYTLVLYEDGSIQVIGSNPYVANQVNTPGRIASLAAGKNHALLLEEGGRLYSWGYNPCGQCGVPHGPILKDLQLIDFPHNIFESITGCAAGDNHSLALTSEGRLFSFGHNDLGQLGNPEAQAFATTLVEFPLSPKITRIACGLAHSLALTEDGKVFSWGWGGYGQLGDGHTEDRQRPVEIEVFKNLQKKVKAIACGGWHSMALTEDGQVYTWGWGEFGALGHGDKTAKNEPTLLDTFSKDKITIKTITAGSRHSLFGADDGRVFGCGLSSQGQLGEATEAPLKREDATDVLWRPTQIQTNQNPQVWKVFSGNSAWGSVFKPFLKQRRRHTAQQREAEVSEVSQSSGWFLSGWKMLSMHREAVIERLCKEMTSTMAVPSLLNSSLLSIGSGITLSAPMEFNDRTFNNVHPSVGEELSLLKQKMEAFSTQLRTSRISSDEEGDEEEAYRHKRAAESTTSPLAKRHRASPDISSTWMNMFSVAKKTCIGGGPLREADSDIQDWIQRQLDQHSRGGLSQERVELLRMIGIEFSTPRLANESSHSDDSRNSEDDYDESEAKDAALDSQRSLRSRSRSSSILAPPSLMLGANFKDEPKGRLGKRTSSGKKKANLKRNSLHNWVYNQRRLQYEGNLPIHRKKLLDKIGFDWKWVQQKIDEQAAQAQTQPLIEKMEEMDEQEIPSSKSEELWMTRYRELIEFKQVHGHYEVPRYVE